MMENCIIVYGWNREVNGFDPSKADCFLLYVTGTGLNSVPPTIGEFREVYPEAPELHIIESIKFSVNRAGGYRAEVKVLDLYGPQPDTTPVSLLSGRALLWLPPVIARLPVSVVIHRPAWTEGDVL